MALGVLGAGQAQALTISLFNSFNFGGSTYRTYLADQPISWTTARNYAIGVTTTGLTGPALGGAWDLVSINSAAENTAIFNQIDTASLWNNSGFAPSGPLIGLFQPNGSTEPAGGWRWVDGTLASYTSWAGGEPNNSGSCSNVTGASNCESVASFRGVGGGLTRLDKWNDVTIGPTTIIVNGFPVGEPGGPLANNFFSFVVESPVKAPGPLPISGALAAFGTSRKLRKRIKATKAVGASITVG